MIQPFEMMILNLVEVFNEMNIIICTYCMIIYTDFVDDAHLKRRAGWGIIAIVSINLFVNIGVIGVYAFRLIR